MAKHYDRGQEAPGLRTLRKRTGLSQEELAQKAGLGVVTIKRLETGHKANYKTLDVLAATLSAELGEQITRRMLITPPATS